MSRKFNSPSNLRGRGDIRGPLEQHIRDLQRSAGHYVLFREAIASGSSSTLEVTEIPQTHHDLIVMFHGSHDGTALNTLSLRLNGDTATNYRWVSVRTDGDAAPALAPGIGVNAVTLGVIGDDNDLTSAVVNIHGYSAKKNHALNWQSFGSSGGVASQSRYYSGSGAHIGSAPITSIQIICTGQNFDIATLRVYGVGPVGL